MDIRRVWFGVLRVDRVVIVEGKRVCDYVSNGIEFSKREILSLFICLESRDREIDSGDVSCRDYLRE